MYICCCQIEFHGRWVPHIEKFVTSGRRSRTVVSIAGFRYSQEPKLKAVVDLDDDDRKTNVWIVSHGQLLNSVARSNCCSSGLSMISVGVGLFRRSLQLEATTVDGTNWAK